MVDAATDLSHRSGRQADFESALDVSVSRVLRGLDQKVTGIRCDLDSTTLRTSR